MTAKKKRTKKLTPAEQERRDKLSAAAFTRRHEAGEHAEGPAKQGCPLCAEATAVREAPVQDTILGGPPSKHEHEGTAHIRQMVHSHDGLPDHEHVNNGDTPPAPEALTAPPVQGPTDAMGTPLLPGTVTGAHEENLDLLSRSQDPGAIEKERQHAVALAAAKQADAEAKVAFPEIGDANGDVVLHVLEDGFTAVGKTWYHGEQISITKGSNTDALARDRFGNAFYDMGEAEQVVRYGKVMFRLGEWPGLKVDPDVDDPEYVAAMNSPDPKAALQKLQKKRARAAPVKVGV